MSHTLSEFESKQWLAQAGVDVPPERLARDAGGAVEAARALGHPVALKLCGRGIAHKTERGLVRLGLANDAAVRAAARELLARRGQADKGAGLLVQRMLAGRRELIAGLVRDPQFGPCVMLGLGGIFAEALDDVAFAVAPLAAADAAELCDALVHARLLGPFRGEPAVERTKLAAILQALGRIGLEHPEVRSIDLNPLIVCDGVPQIADALVELEGAA